MAHSEPQFNKDAQHRKITVEKTFEAPLAQVWDAWTKSSLLDKWWAPKPYRAETKSMDFNEGGVWLYSMAGQGERHWSRMEFKTIVPHKSIQAMEGFCDAHGHMNKDMPGMEWLISFSGQNDRTSVLVEINYPKEADM